MAEQPQGTEYTLQGVMRFLQIEWHSHERARNAWDIERAEMKAKIAKQEGDCRSAKKLNESLDRQIRMLEKALKSERAKNKAIAAGDPLPAEEDIKKNWNGKIGVKADLSSNISNASGGTRDSISGLVGPDELERDGKRDGSRQFLQKCVEELTYLLTPPTHPVLPQPSAQGFQQGGYPGQQENHVRTNDPYVQQQIAQEMEHQQQQKQLQMDQMKRNQHAGLSHLPSLANHLPPPQNRPTSEYYNHLQLSQAGQQNQVIPRQPPNQQFSRETAPSNIDETLPTLELMGQKSLEDRVEKITHTFDASGRPIASRNDETSQTRPLIAEDTDGWNFDDTTLLESTQETAPPRRPDTDLFPSANVSAKSPPRALVSHRRKSSGSAGMIRNRSSESHEQNELSSNHASKTESSQFKVRFALRGHLDVVRSIIFTGGGSPSEPEICTTGDDGLIKRWIIPASYVSGTQKQQQTDLDIQSYFTHRGHEGIVTCLAACPASPSFSTGGRNLGDGWIFSGGQDATVRVWERGRVDPKATLDGHTDAVWAVCVLPTSSSFMGSQEVNSNTSHIAGDRILLASGSADRTIKIWSVSAPPQIGSPQNPPSGSRRGTRRHSVTSGSGFPSSPQPSTASGIPFHHQLLNTIEWPTGTAASPTCITPLGTLGDSFVVSYSDSSILIFDTRTGEEVIGMASNETYDGTPATGVNSIVVSSINSSGFEISSSTGMDSGRISNASDDDGVVHGATGNSKGGGVEGVVISGHEDRFVRFFDANSGQCTYSMLAHPSSIACLSLSPDGRELVSAGHDASLRFWSLEKRKCIQEMTSHRVMRGEGVVSVVWSQDGRWVVSGGGDGVIKVFSR